MNLDDIIGLVCEDIGAEYRHNEFLLGYNPAFPTTNSVRVIESEHSVIYLRVYQTSFDITGFKMKIPGYDANTRTMDLRPHWHVDIHDPESIEDVILAINKIIRFSKSQQEWLAK